MLPATDRSNLFTRWHQCAYLSKTMLLGYTRICPLPSPNGISIGLAHFCRFTTGFKSQPLGNSLGQTVHTQCASVHQAAKLVAALLRVLRVTAGLAESNGSQMLGLWLMSTAGWLPRTGISSGTLCSAIEWGYLYRIPHNCHTEIIDGLSGQMVFDWTSF